MAKSREAQIIPYDPDIPARLREEAEVLQGSDLEFDVSLAKSYFHVAEELERGNKLTLRPPRKALIRKGKVSYIEVSWVGDDGSELEVVSETEALSAKGLPDFFGVVFQGTPDARFHQLAALDASLAARRNIVFEAFPAMRPETV